jgi:ABC-2 type transporter
LQAGLGVFGSAQAIWSRKAHRAARPVRGASSPALAIARKDWLGFRRDIRRLSRLIPALLFPIGYVFAVARPSQRMGGFWAEVFLVGFMSMFMATSLATPSIPSERRGFQLLRMAPLPMWQVLRAKILLTLPPVLAMTIVFSVVVAMVSHETADRAIELGALVVWLGCGFVAVGVSAGGIDPRFDALDDRRAVGLVGTLAGLGGSLGFGLLSAGALALFIYGGDAIGGATRLGPIPSTPQLGALMWSTGVVLAAGSLAIVGLLLWLANTRLRSNEAAVANT